GLDPARRGSRPCGQGARGARAHGGGEVALRVGAPEVSGATGGKDVMADVLSEKGARQIVSIVEAYQWLDEGLPAEDVERLAPDTFALIKAGGPAAFGECATRERRRA